jgi:hypothetical protein
MRNFQRHRRSLTWLASLSAATVIATFGATAVLAEGPTCVAADGHQVTQEELAADPTLCPTDPAADPAPADPAPADPAPADPAPVDPAPTDPAPADPAPVDPAATDPAATDPAATTATDPATDPATTTAPDPAQPTASDPAAPTTDGTTDPQSATPTDPTPPTEATPDGTTPTSGTPTSTTPEQPRRPQHAHPAPKHPKASPVHQRTIALLRAKTFQAAPYRDARLFREQFTPAGRIPEQPRMTREQATLLVDGAKGTGTSWSTLAAVAWLESRWGDPSAGGLVGRRLTDAQWKAYGADGDADGKVTRSSAADQARTVATFLAEARTNDHNALAAYFNGTRRDVMADRAEFLADYFDALGSDAAVHGLSDPAVRKALETRVLANHSIDIYDGGRSDIESGLVDPRVLVTLGFLANRFDTVTVSALISGHGVYTSGGNVSLHSYGQAVDVAALGGQSIAGHQQRGGKTWNAVREVLLLPKAMQPAELISLWDMGGASFALPDHDDHIHIGFKTEPGPAA